LNSLPTITFSTRAPVRGVTLKPEKRTSRERHKLKWEDNQMDMGETRREGSDCIQVPEDMVRWCGGANIVENLRIPQKQENFLTN
jgi:hypothetical protein